MATCVQARGLALDSDYLAWAHTMTVEAAINAAATAGGGTWALDVRDRVFAESGLDPNTMRRRVATLRWLNMHGLQRVAQERLLPIGVACLVVLNRRIDDPTRGALVAELCELAARDPAICIRAVAERRLRELSSRRHHNDEWFRSTDDWHFDSCDPRCGYERPGRVPGQAYLNLLQRFRPDAGPVVIAMSGTGSGLDACALLGVDDYVGFDSRCYDEVEKRHGSRVLVHDATTPDWSPICPPESGGLVIVAPPPFTFGGSTTTGGPTDLGSIPDPDDYLAALGVVLANAYRVLAVDGVFAVVTRNTAEFENGTPVPNLVHRVTSIIESLGLECFLGCPIVTVGRRKSRPHDGPWLVPEVWHVPIYRKTSP